MCQAIIDRYPRTSYLTLLYSQKWALGERDWKHPDRGAKYEEMFARFNNSCFGVWALDHHVHAQTGDIRPMLRRLVGLYPDTRMAREVARYQN